MAKEAVERIKMAEEAAVNIVLSAELEARQIEAEARREATLIYDKLINEAKNKALEEKKKAEQKANAYIKLYLEENEEKNNLLIEAAKNKESEIISKITQLLV